MNRMLELRTWTKNPDDRVFHFQIQDSPPTIEEWAHRVELLERRNSEYPGCYIQRSDGTLCAKILLRGGENDEVHYWPLKNDLTQDEDPLIYSPRR